MSKITHVEIRMYRMGTGDCFALKFFEGKGHVDPSFKMLIDAGTWSGSEDHLKDYIADVKAYVNEYVDILVITHEHKDHVSAFDVCEKLFCDGKFSIGEVWFGWTENDKAKKVKQWKDKYGEKKKALGLAAQKLGAVIDSNEYKRQFAGSRHSVKLMEARKNFSNVLSGFADLHMSVNGEKVYKGGLDGMEIIKTKVKKKEVKYFVPGDIISDLPGAEGIKIYVLGPPKLYEDIHKKADVGGNSYEHNNSLIENNSFTSAVLNFDEDLFNEDSNLLPFDERYIMKEKDGIQNEYCKYDWRRIDSDWLYSSGALALRMNCLTNNLSLALAIEFESGKVMLFPGDAEYGSWASWHNIPWAENGKDGKHLTEDLLNRTVFYKVAHHLSHNGTAQRLGLEMMKSKDLVAMATLDYNVINDGWKSTMPNRAIIKELLTRTKGRLMIMNEEGLFYDFNEEISISEKIEEARAGMTKKESEDFIRNKVENSLFAQFTIQV